MDDITTDLMLAQAEIATLTARAEQAEAALRAQPKNEPLTETERAVAGMIENECMRENLTALCKSYGVTEADFFGFLYRNTPAPGKEE